MSHNTGEFPSSDILKRHSAKKKRKKKRSDVYQRYGLIESVSVEIRVWYNVEYEKGARVPLFEVPFFSSMTDKNRVHAPRMTRRMCNEG